MFIKNLLFFLLLLTLISCKEEKSPWSIRAGNLSVTPKGAKVSKASVVGWKVGKPRVSEVSRGLLVKFRLPQFEEDFLRNLKTKGADSLVLRVRKQGTSSNQILGYLFVPLFKKVRAHKDPSPSSPKEVFFNIYYAAASMGRKLFADPCPILDHNKVIGSFEVQRNYSSDTEMLILQQGILNAEVQRSSLTPFIFNSGNELVAEYFFSFAFYNSNSKLLYSDFRETGQKVVVLREETKSVTGCP